MISLATATDLGDSRREEGDSRREEGYWTLDARWNRAGRRQNRGCNCKIETKSCAGDEGWRER
jgi:hypothetical protein